MEPRLGADLSSVKLHTGGDSAQAAAGFGARAFTAGTDVHFASGQFAPGTKEGDRLLAHELTHVVQGQRSGIQRKADQGPEAPDRAATGGAHGGAEQKGAEVPPAGGAQPEGVQGADAHGGAPEVSEPHEPAEQEADAVGDKVADELHGGGAGAATGQEPGTQAAGGPTAEGLAPGAAPSAAAPKPAQISAKLDGVGTKLFRSATPHADAALTHVRSNGAGAGGAQGAQVTVPTTYDAYVAHIRTTFAADLDAIQVMKEQQKGKGGEAQQKELKLKLDAEELNWYRHELEVMGREVTSLTKPQKSRNETLKAITGYQGMTMEQLHQAMSDLIKKYEGKLGNLAKNERKEIESLMLASIELGGQLNPETSGKVRLLYLDKIDNQENPRLVKVAESEGMPPEQLAELGVKYRTWSKTFVRTELMDDKLAAEILFMRDLGADGNQIGVTPEGLAEKLFQRAQEKAGVPADKQLPFTEASQAQQLQTFKDMLEKAKETNPEVNAALTAPRMRRPLGLPDDQPSPPPTGAP
jgi:hypothetical protein